MISFRDYYTESVIKLTPSDPNVKTYLSEVSSWGKENPFNYNEYIIDNVKLELSNARDKVRINFIGSISPKKGDGTKLMNRLIELADKMNIKLSLSPDVVGDEGIKDIRKLIGWYKRFGFKGGLDGMIRIPNE
jgi:hypothetical protein